MKLALLASIAVALLLGATPAMAGHEIPYYEDVQYTGLHPTVEGTTCLDSTPIVDSEVTYEGPHLVIHMEQSSIAEATSEDPAFWKEAPEVEASFDKPGVALACR